MRKHRKTLRSIVKMVKERYNPLWQKLGFEVQPIFETPNSYAFALYHHNKFVDAMLIKVNSSLEFSWYDGQWVDPKTPSLALEKFTTLVVMKVAREACFRMGYYAHLYPTGFLEVYIKIPHPIFTFRLNRKQWIWEVRYYIPLKDLMRPRRKKISNPISEDPLKAFISLLTDAFLGM